jgi:hypothetical protein
VLLIAGSVDRLLDLDPLDMTGLGFRDSADRDHGRRSQWSNRPSFALRFVQAKPVNEIVAKHLVHPCLAAAHAPERPRRSQLLRWDEGERQPAHFFTGRFRQPNGCRPRKRHVWGTRQSRWLIGLSFTERIREEHLNRVALVKSIAAAHYRVGKSSLHSG